MKKLLLLAMMLFITAMITRVQAVDEIDIGIYSTSCSDFDVRVSSAYAISGTSLTNVQFAVKYPASVTLGDITSSYPVALQYTTTVGSDKYSVFIGVDVPISTWVIGTQYTILSFGIDHAASSSITLVIGNDTWTSSNNAIYYAELLGINKTGVILAGASENLRVHNTDLNRYYCKIQEAVDDASTGNTIVVAAGTYVENVLVNKSLTINGAQAGNDPRSTGTTPRSGGESIVRPATVNTTFDGVNVFTISANNVIIDGFTFDGNNSSLTGGINVNGVEIHAARAVSNAQPLTGISYLTVKNNIIQNFYRQGVLLYTSTYTAQQNNLVEKNVFDNIHRLSADGTATGVYMEQEATSDVKNNKMNRVGRGIMTATLGAVVNTPFEFSGNDITSYYTGIWVNNHHSAAPVCSVLNNDLYSESSSTNNDGMRITSMFVANELIISGNDIDGKRYGYYVWNCPSNTVSIIGGTVLNCDRGAYFTNYYSGFGDANPSSYVIENVAFQSPATSGIFIQDNSLNTNGATVSVVAKNVSISGTATGLSAFRIEGAGASLSFSGAAPQATVTGAPKYFVLQSNGTDVPAGNIDATQVMLDTYYGSTMPNLTTLFTTEDKIDHKIDLATLGFVTVKANNDFVTVNSFVSPNTSPLIQRAIDAASAGWTVNVGPGTFSSEAIIVNKSLIVLGGNSGLNANKPDDITLLNPVRSAESILPNTTMQVTATNVSIDGFKLTGASGIHTNGVAANAADGLSIINNVFEDITMSAYNNSSGASPQTGITFNNNRVDGNNSASVSAMNPWDGITVLNISGNYFTQFERGVQLDHVSSVNVTDNYFTGITHQGLQVATVCSDIDILRNVFDNCNLATQSDRGAIRLYAGVTGTITIENNFFTNNYNAIRLRSADPFAHSYFEVHSNSFTLNTMAISDGSTGSTGFIDATCNWYGTSNVSGVTALNSGNVTYDPWLVDGTDDEPATFGFQPAGTCTGATDLYVNDLVSDYPTNDIYTTNPGNDGNAGTAAAPFLTITKAVNTAVYGTNIWVDAGMFQEQVRIQKTLNLTGVDRTKTIVKAPASLVSFTGVTYQIIRAEGEGNEINISNILVDGDNGRNHEYFYGVQYASAGGTFENNRITGIRAPLFNNYQFTIGLVANHTYDTPMDQTVTVKNNIIDDYGKAGIVISELNTEGIITNNTITGQNIPNVVGQNGIQMGYGAYGTITGNSISGNIWNELYTHVWLASGILINGVGVDYTGTSTGYATTISGNIINGNEAGLYTSGDSDYGYTPNYNLTLGINNFADNKIHATHVDPVSVPNAGNIYDKRVDNPAQTNIVYGCIQYAVDEAAPAGGDILNVSTGTFIENVTVNKRLEIIGSGSSLAGTVVQGVGGTGIVFDYQAGGSGLSGSPAKLTKVYLTAAQKGVYLGTNDYINLDDLDLVGLSTYGIELFNNNTIEITNSTFTSGASGIRLGSTASGNGLLIDGCTFSNNSEQAIHAFASATGGLTNVTITDNSITNCGLTNNMSAMYFEKLSNANISNNIITNTGDAANPRGIVLNYNSAANSNVSITGNTLTENRTTVASLTAGYAIRFAGFSGGSLNGVNILSNNIDGYRTGVEYGAAIDRTTIQIKNNFINNVQLGVLAYSGTSSSGTLINDNSFTNLVTGVIQTPIPSPFAILNADAAGTPVSATCNWYGTNTVVGVGALIIGTVNYTPWLVDGTDDPMGGVGFQPLGTCTGATDLYVNDGTFDGNDIYTDAVGNDANPGTEALPFLTITKAVNTAVDGTKIWVDAGTFQEQIQIGKTLNLTGVDSVKTIILAPATLPLTGYWYSAPNTSQPIVYAYGTGNTININKLCINGGGGRSVDHFIGMEYYEANGTFDQNKITGIHDAGPFTGMQRGHAFYGMYFGMSTQTLNITNNLFIDYQKGGIYVDGAGANTDVLIDGNRVIGQGVANVTAQNGIAPAWCDVIISNNTVTNNIWNKIEHPHQWMASGILLYETETSNVFGNTMNGNEVGLWGSNTVLPTYGINTFNNNKVHVYEDVTAHDADFIYDKRVDNPAQLYAVYGCIQYAIDEASSGDVLNASIGTFEEQVVVHTSVDLRGPKYGVSGYDVSRGTGEAIVKFPSGLTPNAVTEEDDVVNVTADDVIIDGFTVDGQNYDPLGYYQAVGIMSVADNSVIRNNRVFNSETVNIWVSSYYWDGSTWATEYRNGAVIENNYTANTDIFNRPDMAYAYGIYVQGAYGDVLNNVVEDCRAGIQIQPYNHPNSTTDVGTVSGNSFEGYSKGMYFNYSENTNGNWQFSNNFVSGIAPPTGVSITEWDGIAVQTYTGGLVDFSENSITFGGAVATNKYTVKNFSTQSFNATCNWHGTAGGDLIAPMITGTVNYIPWLVNGTDNDLVTPGFQPVPGSCAVPFSLKVILQGPYDSGTGLMNTDINAANKLPLGQPYYGSPWNYTGTETLPSPLSADIVDWVLIQLREDDGITVFKTIAGLLYKDGTINASFDDVGQNEAYHIVVFHRNHMPVMTKDPITISNYAFPYDFKVLGNLYGTNPAILLGGSTYAMIAGDVTKNGMLKYSGPNNDRGPIIARIVAENGGSNNINNDTDPGYWQEDVTMNSIVLYLGTANDRGPIQSNLNTLTGAPYLNNTYTSVVPGAYTGGKEGSNEGPVDIQFAETAEMLTIEIITNEFITSGMVDNIQFTLAWKTGDDEIEAMLSNLTSGFNLLPQGDAIEVDGVSYLTYVSVTPTYLPEAWDNGELVSVISFVKDYGQLISTRLWIADDDFTASHNGEFYVSNWGTDVTGMILNATVGVESANAGYVKLYPNPVSSGKLFLEVNTDQDETLVTEVWDMAGKLVKKLDNQVTAGTSKLIFDVTEFNTGVYLINVIGDKVLYRDRFIVK